VQRPFLFAVEETFFSENVLLKNVPAKAIHTSKLSRLSYKPTLVAAWNAEFFGLVPICLQIEIKKDTTRRDQSEHDRNADGVCFCHSRSEKFGQGSVSFLTGFLGPRLRI
jgi:hypothetical protein